MKTRSLGQLFICCCLFGLLSDCHRRAEEAMPRSGLLGRGATARILQPGPVSLLLLAWPFGRHYRERCCPTDAYAGMSLTVFTCGAIAANCAGE